MMSSIVYPSVFYEFHFFFLKLLKRGNSIGHDLLRLTKKEIISKVLIQKLCTIFSGLFTKTDPLHSFCSTFGTQMNMIKLYEFIYIKVNQTTKKETVTDYLGLDGNRERKKG